MIACFTTTLAYALRWGYGFAFLAWFLTGTFIAVVAGGVTLLCYFVLSKVGKVQVDFKSLIAATGIGALIPAALTLVVLPLCMISTWFFNFFAVIIFAVWAVEVFITVTQVFEIKMNLFTLLIIIGFFVAGYYAIAEFRDAFVSAVWTNYFWY